VRLSELGEKLLDILLALGVIAMVLVVGILIFAVMSISILAFR
jgi:hypothetical protein